ncbi:uncharacterized protein V6R79_015266 [Siganus canaliculatus]
MQVVNCSCATLKTGSSGNCSNRRSTHSDTVWILDSNQRKQHSCELQMSPDVTALKAPSGPPFHTNTKNRTCQLRVTVSHAKRREQPPDNLTAEMGILTCSTPPCALFPLFHFSLLHLQRKNLPLVAADSLDCT